MSNEDVTTAYNNSHRAFLQAFLARSVLTFEEAKPILAAIFTAHEQKPIHPSDITPQDLTIYIHTLNTSLSTLDLEIRPTHSQDAVRTPLYVLVNCTSDPLTQLATIHSPDEIAFVKRVLDAIFETHNSGVREVLAVSSLQALRLAKVPRRSEGGGGEGLGGGAAAAGLTQVQADEMLDALVAEGWFEVSRAGFYGLAPRALVELRGWLVEMYNEGPTTEEPDAEVVERVRFCEACREIVTVGVRCEVVECGLRLHDGCVAPFFRTVGGVRRCTRCRAEWTGNHFVGERCLGGRAVVGGGRRSTTGGRSSGTVDEDEEDEDDDDV